MAVGKLDTRTQSAVSLLVVFLVSQLVVKSYCFSATLPRLFGHRTTTHASQSSTLFSSSTDSRRKRRPPSQVDNTEPPTPPYEGDPFPIIDATEIEAQIAYNRSDHPVPGQPWRRGDTDGCHDDIRADWRVEAEDIIVDAVKYVGAELHGITWGMSQLIVSLRDVSNVEGIIEGPEIVVDRCRHYDPDLGPNYHWKPTMDEDELEEYMETHARVQNESFRVDEDVDVDTSAMSAVAQSIRESLEVAEDRLQVLARHELILTEPTEQRGVLQTQAEFDEHRGYHVKVLTRDPWKSNRTLEGKLVARTALDILINVDGRVVTIPQNFVYQTILDDDYLEYEEEEE